MLLIDVHAIDLTVWGDALIKAGAMTAALYGLYRVWIRPVVRWFQHQGEMNIQVASVVAEQLPKMTKAIERVSNVQNEHDAALSDLRGRVQRLEGGADEPSEVPMTRHDFETIRRRLRGGSHIPGPAEPDLPPWGPA